MRQTVPYAVAGLLVGCGLFGGRETDGDGGPSGTEGVAYRAGQADADGVDGGSGPLDASLPPPVPPYMTCFAAGTPIDTPSGEHAIEQLAVGDAVWAFDTARGVRVQSRVTAVHHHREGSLGRLTLPSGRELWVTPEHPIYLPEQDRFVPIGALAGDELVVMLDDSGLPQVSSSAPSFEPKLLTAPVYNISVEAFANYFAAGVLVHNKQAPRCPNDDWSATACMPYISPPIPIVTCFAEGTPIATPTGERAIEQLAVGDEVWAFDTESGTRVARRVLQTHHHPAQSLGLLTLPNGRDLFVTANHPIYVAQRDAYIPAGELHGGEMLLALNGDGDAALAAAPAFVADAAYLPVHNLTVEGTHNYFAAGTLVHNKTPPPCAEYNWQTRMGCDRPLAEPGPTCAAYPAAPITSAEYVNRLRSLVGNEFVDGSLFSDPGSAHPRNEGLFALFDNPAAPGRALARWLRVPMASVARSDFSGDLGQQLTGQLVMDMGNLLVRTLGADLRELLQYRDTVLSPTLAEFYGLPALDPAVASQNAQLPQERLGVLTEGAFLRAHPTPSDRGRVLGEQLLCGMFLPHVPPAAPPAQTGTRYAVYAALGTTPVCMSCHATIDGIGLALEQFDADGAYRPIENGQNVPSTGQVAGAVDGPAGLANALLVQPMLADCVARSLLSDALQRPLVAADDCSVQWIVDSMMPEFNMRAALLAVLTSPALLHVKPAP